MPRPPGRRNRDFEQKRYALIETLTEFVLTEGVELPSFRQLAIAAGTSEPTLRHYFSDRSGVIVAIIIQLSLMGEPVWMGQCKTATSIDETIDQFLDHMMYLQKSARYTRAYAFCMRESMSDEQARKAFLDHVVEPHLDLIAERLMKTRGGPASYEVARAAATMLSSSSMFTVMHQNILGGESHKPIDIDSYFQLLRGWMLDSIRDNPKGLFEKA